MLWSIAWRNLWRNKKRSGTILCAIAFGLWAGLFSGAIMEGYKEQMVSDAVYDRTAHLQVHRKGFLEYKQVGATLPRAETIRSVIDTTQGVAQVLERAVVPGMGQSASTGTRVLLYGIDPAAERAMQKIDEQIIAGDYFEADQRNSCVVGRKLAETLNLELGNKIVVQAQALDGSLTGGAFRITGIFKTVMSEFDHRTIFARRQDVDRIFALDGQVHSIRVLAEDFGRIEAVKARIEQNLANLEEAPPGGKREEPRAETAPARPAPDQAAEDLLSAVSVLTWAQVEPQMGYMQATSSFFSMIFLAIILLALVFGITNTMLMAVMERVREIGVMAALGMHHGRIFAMIMLETIVLALLGGSAGIVLGIVTTMLFAHVGIDLSIVSAGLESAGMSAVIHPEFAPELYPATVLLVVVTAVVSAIYPGVKAARLSPVEAIRTYG